MIIHIPTGAQFRTRKEAKELIGLQKYRKLARKGEFYMYFQNKKKIRTFKIYYHFTKCAKMRHY